MKKTLLLAVSLCFAFLSVPSLAKNGGEDMVAIIHKPGTPAEKEMMVPESAVDGHMRHGDAFPEPPEPPEPPAPEACPFVEVQITADEIPAFVEVFAAGCSEEAADAAASEFDTTGTEIEGYVCEVNFADVSFEEGEGYTVFAEFSCSP